LLQAHFPVSVIADGVGLNITAMSYRNHIDFGIVADRQMMNDAWPLMAGVKAACAELEEVVCGPKRASAPQPQTAAPGSTAGP
jgi:hypothetical protein